MAYTPNEDLNYLAEAIHALEPHAQPVLDRITELEKLDQEIDNLFTDFDIKKRGTKRRKVADSIPSEESDPVKRLRKLYCYAHFAHDQEVNIELNNQYTILKNDILDRVFFDMVEDNFRKNTHISNVDLDTSESKSLSEAELEARIIELNEYLQKKVIINEADVTAEFDKLRARREKICLEHLENLKTVYSKLQATKKTPGPTLVQKKTHMFSTGAKRPEAAKNNSNLGKMAFDNLAKSLDSTIKLATLGSTLTSVQTEHTIKKHLNNLLDIKQHWERERKISEFIDYEYLTRTSIAVIQEYTSLIKSTEGIKHNNLFDNLKKACREQLGILIGSIGTAVDAAEKNQKSMGTYKASDFDGVRKLIVQLLKNISSLDLN